MMKQNNYNTQKEKEKKEVKRRDGYFLSMWRSKRVWCDEIEEEESLV